MNDKVTLFPYQTRARDFLAARRRAYLADVPRLGKTDAALAAAVQRGARQCVVICPAAVRTAWRRKLTQSGFPENRVWTYEGAVKHAEFLADIAKRDDTVLIIDEAHYLANRTAMRTKKLLGMAGPARLASTVWLLSGTPMAKHPGQLFPVLASLFPEVLQDLGAVTFDSFLKRYTWGTLRLVRGQRVYKPMGAKNGGELHNALFVGGYVGSGPKFLRRTEWDVEAEFPPLTWEIVALDDEAGREAVDEIVDGNHVTDAEDGALAARQAAGKAKVPLILDMALERLSDASTGQLVIMAHFRESLDTLEAGLRDARVPLVRLDGRTPATARQSVIDGFQSGKARVFLGSIRACQTGITLDSAHEVWLAEPDWTADVNVQAGKRAFSLNQKRPCLTKLFVLSDTIDEAIIRSHERELAMHGAVLDPTQETHEDVQSVWHD